MADTLTLRYDDETHRIIQTYWGENPAWDVEDGTTITTIDAPHNIREQEYALALEDVSDSDYNADAKTPVPYLKFDPATEQISATVEFMPLPEDQ